jgi:double zinc ribbon protein
VDDLRHFFHLLVGNLAATDPARLRGPLPVGEIRQTILPYRANRRALQLESSEDYELVLIRLCGGEGGFARTEPDDVHAKFASEGLNSNPDLTIVDRYETAALILNQEQVTRALGRNPELAFAPPDQRLASPAVAEPASPGDRPPAGPDPNRPPAGGLSAATCTACGRKLPPGPGVRFCPHCGRDQTRTRCPECQTEIEVAWRHCVNCGSALKGA